MLKFSCILALVFAGWTSVLASTQPHAPGRAGAAVTDVGERLVKPLSAIEREWLASKPKLRLGIDRNGWAPIDMVDAKGIPFGISASVLKRVQELVPINIEPVIFPNFPAVLTALKRGEVDIVASAGMTPDRLEYLAFTEPYLANPMVTVVRRGTTKSPAALTIAVETGTPVAETLQRSEPNARLLRVESTLEALKAVSEGRADQYFGAVMPVAYHIDQALLINLEVQGIARFGDADLRIGIRKSLPPAVESVLDKALLSISEDELRRFRAPWVDPARLLARAGQAPLELSAADRATLADRKVVRVAYDPSFAPFTVATDGAPTGLSVDLVETALARLGIRAEWVRGRDFADVLTTVRERRADLVAATAITRDRQAYLRFAGPYNETPTALVGGLGGAYYNELRELEGRTLALPTGHFLRDWIRERGHTIRIIDCETVAACLQRVRQGEAAFAASNLGVVSAILQENHLGSLQVVGTVSGAPSRLYIGVRDDWSDLKWLIDKALLSIDEPTRLTLQKRWLNVEYRSGLRWDEVLRWGVPIVTVGLALLLLFLGWNRYLAREVTRREHAEAVAKVARDDAARASAAKSRFLAVLGHEIRTPMNGVLGILDMLRSTRLSPEQAGWVRTADTSARSLLRLLNDLLDFSKLDAEHMRLRPSLSRVDQLFEEACMTFAVIARERGVPVVWRPSLALIGHEFMVDPVRLRQVAHNLIGNAVKFTQCGSIHVQYAFDMTHETLSLIVEDTGPGMSAADLADLGKPFATFQATSKIAGTGLGLAICHRIGALMQGELKVQSQPGTGSRFEFVWNDSAVKTLHHSRPDAGPANASLGLADAIQAALTTRPDIMDSTRHHELIVASVTSHAEGLQRAQMHTDGTELIVLEPSIFVGLMNVRPNVWLMSSIEPIQWVAAHDALTGATPPALMHEGAWVAPAGRALIVDDHPVNRMVLEHQLACLGWSVETAVNAEAALERNRATVFDWIIVDRHLPGMDGYALIQTLRADEATQDRARAVIVALSADAGDDAESAARHAGADHYLTKPTSTEALQAFAKDAFATKAALPKVTFAAFDLAHFAAHVGEATPTSLRAFMEALMVDTADLEAAQARLSQDGGTALVAAVHRIKGAALSAGVDALSRAATRVEHALGANVQGDRGPPSPEVDAEVRYLLDEGRRTIEQIRAVLDQAAP
jgi:two-component system, NarL family, sensor histidine kinase EvgS